MEEIGSLFAAVEKKKRGRHRLDCVCERCAHKRSMAAQEIALGD